MLSKSQFNDRLHEELGFVPTAEQIETMRLLTDFVFDHNQNQLFILKGYAGTGKTTTISALVRTLRVCRIKSVLLAPTGRAAKVFSNYARKKAFTIHKHIYKVETENGQSRFARKENKLKHTLFIVDEVSMIAHTSTEGTFFARQQLLSDLMHFVFDGESCKLLFMGDEAQLPPVHLNFSPALDIEYLKCQFYLNVVGYQLTEVVRQALHSGILFNATRLREKISNADATFPFFSGKIFPDFKNIAGSDVEELYHTLYGKLDCDDIVTITRSNKRACRFNMEIRQRILFREDRIAAGDYLMIVKNNYYWVDDRSEVGFLANGEMIELLSIQKTETLYGFCFADVTVRLCDYPEHPDLSVKILLDSIESDTPALSPEQNRKLYDEIALDYADIADPLSRFLKIKNDPYLNALQVKFGYALTCHKTQGGQWQNVVVDCCFRDEPQQEIETLRWLYTAITRASRQVYLLNFPRRAFESEGLIVL
ncbi:MAG: AAA family ATPase [Bacteroidales bacterium]|jgi:exodeoxyribonuclease-5|nr:AAA family ATPase [Bacteroidales bacterium]